MNTGVVKAGGVAAFVTVALYILGMIIGGSISAIFQLIALVLFIFTLVTIKVCMSGLNYQRGGALVWTLIGLIVVLIILVIIAVAVVASTAMSQGQTGGMMNPQAMLTGFGIWGIIIGVVLLAFQVVFLLLGLRMNEFAATAGGIWKGAGIMTIVWTATVLVAVVIAIVAGLAQSAGIFVVVGILFFVGALVFLASWIVVGIALITSSGKAVAPA